MGVLRVGNVRLYEGRKLSLQVRLINSARELETIRGAWNKLHRNTPPPQGHPFNSFAWLFPYARLLEGRGSLLQIFTVYEGDKLVGIAPLRILPGKLLGFKRIQFIGHQFSDYCDFIYCKNHERSVVKALLRHWQSVYGSRAIFDLNLIHESSPSPPLFYSEVQKHGGQIYVIPWEKAPALDLTDGNGKKASTVERILSKKHCRQRIREMEKLGKAEFVTIGFPGRLKAHLERLFCYHRLRWHQRKTYVHSMSEDMQEIYTTCISQMAKEAHAEIVALTINELPYAYAIALKKDEFFYYLMPVHNVFSRYSPGTALLYHLFGYVKDRGYSELDFTIGDEPYKTRFANIVRQNRRLFFTFNPSKAFRRILKLVDHVRNSESLIEYIRSWRIKYNQTNYDLKDYFSRRAGQLRSVNYEATKVRVRSIFSNGVCLIYRLNLADCREPIARKTGFRFQQISAIEAIKFICQFHHSNSPAIWGDLLKREVEGAACYGAFIDDRLAHTSWVTDRDSISIDEIGESLELEDGECCVFDCNTLPQYRGRGAYPRTLMHIAKIKQVSGYRSMYVYTLSYNASSIRGIEKAGFKLGEIRQPTNEGRMFWRQWRAKSIRDCVRN